MGRKYIALLTLMAFILFSISCMTTSVKTERISVKPEVPIEKDARIFGVQTVSGEYINISQYLITQIEEGCIQSYKTVTVDSAEIEQVIEKDGRIYRIETKDGRSLGYLGKRTVKSQEKETLKVEFICKEFVIFLPLSQIDLIWIERTEVKQKIAAGRTIRNVVVAYLAVAGVAAVLMLIALATKESCPFIYSFDGERYVFDAEPYGGAICQGLKRTEWCGLEHLKEINGRYQLLAVNEVNETQYTDELRLAVIDHPKGVQVIPGPFGQIHTISNPIAPNQAYDSTGRDLMPFISKNDRVFWQTRIEEKDPERKEDLKDELIFEFPKPKETKKAKLVLNGCNTLWGSQSLKKYLDLYGYKVSEWYQQMNHHGPIFFKTNNMQLREELYALQIRVETDEGWKSKGLLVGGGPFISENKAYVLDVSDVSGDMLRIKLTPPATFWMINYLAVDYSEDVPVDVQEISPIQAVDNKGQDVREILEQTDNIYLIMPNIGDAVEMIFESPNRDEGLSRSVLLKASGYYDIHLKGEGEPQYKLLDRLHTEPEFVVQYAFQEFLKWRREILARKNPHEQLKRKK